MCIIYISLLRDFHLYYCLKLWKELKEFDMELVELVFLFWELGKSGTNKLSHFGPIINEEKKSS